MKKTTYNVNNKIYKLIIYTIILFVIALAARYLAPNFINVENSFIQIKVEDANASNYNVYYVGLIFLFVMIYNFLYHQIDKAEKGVMLAISLVISGTLANLIDILISNGIVNYIKVGNLFSTSLATCFMIIGWVIWIGSLIMYSSSHDLRLKKIYEAQDEELATGKSSKIEEVKPKKKNKKK